jgi:hypothetical protein
MTYYALSASNCGDSGMKIETDVIIGHNSRSWYFWVDCSVQTLGERFEFKDFSTRSKRLEIFIAVCFSVVIELFVTSAMKIILIIC